MRSQIGEGLRYVWGHRLLRPIALCTASANLFSSMMLAVILLFAYRTLGMTPGVVGVVFALGNVGFLLGATLSRRVVDRLGLGATIVGSAALFSVATLAIPLATRNTGFMLLVAANFIGGFGGVVYNINQVSLRQAITAERMQGRMNATMRFMVWGTMPIGAFIGGILGSSIGLRPTLWVSAIGGLFAFIPPLLSPVRSLERIPDYEEPSELGEILAAGEDGVVDPSVRLP
jgi:MFS family permease